MEAKRTSALEPNLSNYTTIGRLGLWCDEINLWEAHNSYKNVMNDEPLQCMPNYGVNYSYYNFIVGGGGELGDLRVNDEEWRAQHEGDHGGRFKKLGLAAIELLMEMFEVAAFSAPRSLRPPPLLVRPLQRPPPGAPHRVD